MRHLRVFAAILLASTLFTAVTLAQTAAPTAAPPTTRPQRAPAPQPSATIPVIQAGKDRVHQQYVDLVHKGGIDLLFIGDSITDNMHSADPLHGGKAVWDQYYAPLHAANIGIGADRTQNVLWRLQNGELDGFKAKVIVLLLGTNNVTPANAAPRAVRNTNADVVAGMKLVVNEIRTRQPQAKLILMAIFPRGRTGDDPYRQPIKEINAELAKLDDGQNIFYTDINDKFLAPDGSIPMDVMPDQPALHPNDKGYHIWADGIIDKIKSLMAAS